MFAGPNGSGKSTIKSVISPHLLGIYINPDEIEAYIVANGFLDFHNYEVQSTKGEVLNFFQNSTLLKKEEMLEVIKDLRFRENKLIFHGVIANAYFASV
ncbi:MAG: hypothetical protein LLG04_18555, partial [Parachlamydia sp.]|nr:hypothetical protein [Parachlamydia sp.]